jgi:putative salt-induced outer membrane protein YdiY
MKRLVVAIVSVLTVGVLAPARLFAQPPCPCAATPDQGKWIGTAGAGLALTSGNSDTLNLNLSFDATYDPKTKHVVKATGLYIRGDQNDVVVVNRLSLGVRDQYTLSGRAFAFGQLDYLRDTFKAIDYLVAPTAGVGYTVIDTMPTTFAVDGGLGVVWEKNPGVEVDTDVAVTAAERLQHVLTPTSNVHHAATALWKANDFNDGLYTFSVGAGAKLSGRLQLSVDLLDTLKNQPPVTAPKKNDVALVTSITATF